MLKPARAQTYASQWEVRLPDGRTVGQPIDLTYTAKLPATARPTIGATVGPSASSTPVAEGGPLTAVSLRFRSCSYDGAFYLCSVTVNITGGEAPWNVIINGANNGDLTFEVNSPRVWQMAANRCEAVTLQTTVIDGNNDQISNTQTFDPNTTAIFPGGTVCSP